MSNDDLLAEIAKADIRVAHNGSDFDERVGRKLKPWFAKACAHGTDLDTVLISRLLYPSIGKQGPNQHLVPPKLRNSHSLEAWGYRLGCHKDTAFAAGDWQTWSPAMQAYMKRDIPPLIRLFKFLMGQKPSDRSVALEHDFARIIRRQEAWGFTFDASAAAELSAELQSKKLSLETELQDAYGEWWNASPEKTVKTSRSVKMTDFPDVTVRRFSKAGKALAPYVGPPKISYEEGAVFTPIERIQFNPLSRKHVQLVLKRDHNWVPKTFTPSGEAKVDDEVLRALPWPETKKLADLFFATKLLGYVSAGSKAWMTTMHREADEFRQHGRVMTIGAGSFRCAHMDPNMGQVPTRDPDYGHRARALFTARKDFRLFGFDGSAMQLRLLAHYLFPYDGGAFAKVFDSGESPHAYTRDVIGTDIMGEGDIGKAKGKTTNYALVFGGGILRLGQIVIPNNPEAKQMATGRLVKERLNERFQLDTLKDALKTKVEERRYLVGLDGRKCPIAQPRNGLAFLLQMGEAVVMRLALVIMDNWLKEAGLKCGVLPSGLLRPLHDVDYEFAANVHDEAQADVCPDPEVERIYRDCASRCVTEAGRQLGVRCILKSDVKDGETWADTH